MDLAATDSSTKLRSNYQTILHPVITNNTVNFCNSFCKTRCPWSSPSPMVPSSAGSFWSENLPTYITCEHQGTQKSHHQQPQHHHFKSEQTFPDSCRSADNSGGSSYGVVAVSAGCSWWSAAAAASATMVVGCCHHSHGAWLNLCALDLADGAAICVGPSKAEAGDGEAGSNWASAPVVDGQHGWADEDGPRGAAEGYGCWWLRPCSASSALPCLLD